MYYLQSLCSILIIIHLEWLSSSPPLRLVCGISFRLHYYPLAALFLRLFAIIFHLTYRSGQPDDGGDRGWSEWKKDDQMMTLIKVKHGRGRLAGWSLCSPLLFTTEYLLCFRMTIAKSAINFWFTILIEGALRNHTLFPSPLCGPLTFYMHTVANSSVD